ANDHFGAIAKATPWEIELLQFIQPDRAWDGALRVAQLEIGLSLAPAETGYLANQGNACTAAHLFLEFAGVTANGEWSRQFHTTRLSRQVARHPAERQRRAHTFSSGVTGRSSAPASVSE